MISAFGFIQNDVSISDISKGLIPRLEQAGVELTGALSQRQNSENVNTRSDTAPQYTSFKKQIVRRSKEQSFQSEMNDSSESPTKQIQIQEEKIEEEDLSVRERVDGTSSCPVSPSPKLESFPTSRQF